MHLIVLEFYSGLCLFFEKDNKINRLVAFHTNGVLFSFYLNHISYFLSLFLHFQSAGLLAAVTQAAQI